MSTRLLRCVAVILSHVSVLSVWLRLKPFLIVFVKSDIPNSMCVSPNCICVSADVNSDKAFAMQARVLGRVRTEIEGQMQPVDQLLRQLEDKFVQNFNVLMQAELCAKWVRAREHRDEGLAVLDKVSMTGCQATDKGSEGNHMNDEDEVSEGARGGFENAVQKMVQTLDMIRSQHNEMQVIEQQMIEQQTQMIQHHTQMTTAKCHQDRTSSAQQLKTLLGKDCVQLLEQLQRLRQQRVKRPRILLSHSMSSRTGQGLPGLRRVLTALMEDTRLFAHVGAKVPLNYLMLERLSQEGRAQADVGTDHECVDNETGRAEWEQTVTMHVIERASVRLRTVCSRACVSLGALEEAAAEVGMDKAEVHSALLFLHATGSVLHYGNDTQHGSYALQGTVFMQPQFIIDAIKYVIREPSASDINDEVRTLDARIRQNADNAEALNRFLGTQQALGSGVLTLQLLTHLWRHVNPRHHALLLELMMAFKLLRPLDTDTFLVPAMLPRRALPDEYVMPDWWRPSKAAAVAVMHVENVVRPAEMRIMYKVLGGHLPFGFMSELQVRLAVAKGGDKKLHFAPDAAVIDRVYGSVLSAAYKCGGGRTREWVVLSRPLEGQGQGVVAGIVDRAADCICIMGWAELLSREGATDWRVFRMVIEEIEAMQHNAPGLCLRKLVLYVDASGHVAKPLDLLRSHRETSGTSQLFSFEFDDEVKDAEDVDPDLVMPSSSQTKLSTPQQPSQQPAVSASARVEAFFAKTTDDHGIDVHAEGQMMQRIVLDPSCGWECSMNPQPTIDDLYSSLGLAKQRNMRVLHLAGHGRKECGFIWNASESATARREFDVDAISIAIASVAGRNGPMECAVLNACSTEKMGRLLLQRGVPYVVCWKTPVHDDAAKELCGRFYRALVENTSGVRDYKRAFFAATHALQLSSHTRGAAHLPRVAHKGDSAASNSKTRDARLDSNMAQEQVGGIVLEDGKGITREPVQPWHREDVVLFLSKDGDSEPIYLWRERWTSLPTSSHMDVSSHMAAQESTERSLGVEGEAVDTALKALFELRGLGMLRDDVCRELGVECVEDLAHVTPQDLDDLPKYLKDKLKPVQKRKLTTMLGSQVSLKDWQSSAVPPPHVARQQVFLGYRVASDADLVERLYDKLKAAGVNVWWDKRCLPAGQPWEQGFADGLCSSDVFVPILSKTALAPCAYLTAASACDNVLLECRMALELQHRGHVRAIFPVLVGDLEHHSSLGNIHGDFFRGGGMPVCQDNVTVEAVEGKLAEHLERLGLGAPLLPASVRSIKATLAAITCNQGVKLLGVCSDTVDLAVSAIVKLSLG